MMRKIKIAAIGCGARSTTYLTLASKLKNKFIITAGADRTATKVDHIKALSGNSNFKAFKDAKDLLRADQLADVVIIGTQDKYHLEHCSLALKKGYDILLEKPIATSIKDIIYLQELAHNLKRKVLVCYVLRYTKFYNKIKEIIASGKIGKITSLNAVEGVEPWHMAHSFVRGHWAVESEATPMIVAKSCHDTDIIHWLIDKKCKEVHSYGELSYFTKKNQPKNAPRRCTDGCPIEKDCMYNAKRYVTDKRDPWLEQVYPNWKNAKDEDIIDWLKRDKWGRCVYQCDNDVVDSQTLHLQFEDNIKATFTMTAFDEGRTIEIFGTKGVIRAGEFYKKLGADIFVSTHHTGHIEKINIDLIGDEGYGHHMGGDLGIVEELHRVITSEDTSNQKKSFSHSHVIAFAAETSRITHKPVNIEQYYKQYL